MKAKVHECGRCMTYVRKDSRYEECPNAGQLLYTVSSIVCVLGDARLSDGPDIAPYFGRLEICSDGLQWGTVCGVLSPQIEDVACRQMGHDRK